jgi:hypothetical protein
MGWKTGIRFSTGQEFSLRHNFYTGSGVHPASILWYDSMNWMPIKTTETTSLSKTHTKWKSPGSDQIPNYWLKAFPATHSYIIEFIKTIIEEPKANA